MSTEETTLSSYPHSYAVGHRYIAELFNDEVSIEEKVDGSQFSFGMYRINDAIAGRYSTVLRMKSKGQQLDIDNPNAMFREAVEAVKSISHELTDGWTYRAEYLRKPKHNVLAYGRIPRNHLIVFDICMRENIYLSYNAKFLEAERLGFETVPQLYRGSVTSYDQFKKFLNTESILGESHIEGVVIKNYHRTNVDGKILIGKYVSEKFKEKMSGAGHRTVNQNECITDELGIMYRTDARWQKAVQHLRESGQLDDSPKDIGPLLKELAADIERDSVDEIKEALWNWAWPKIRKHTSLGFAEWYKESLAQSQTYGQENT